MKITIAGSGYIGLVTGARFSEAGINVTSIYTDQRKIGNLNKGIIPVFEPGLEKVILRNMKKNRLQFTTNVAEAIHNCVVLFIAAGTPSGEDGSAGLKYVLSVARDCGRYMNDYLLVVTKSTAPAGTSENVRKTIRALSPKPQTDDMHEVPSLVIAKKLLSNPAVFDGRNIYDSSEMKQKAFTISASALIPQTLPLKKKAAVQYS